MAASNIPPMVDFVLRVAEIVVVLVSSFLGAYFGAKAVHKLELAKRTEHAQEFGRVILERLYVYASRLSAYRKESQADLLDKEESRFIVSLDGLQRSPMYYRALEFFPQIRKISKLILAGDYEEALSEISSERSKTPVK